MLSHSAQLLAVRRGTWKGERRLAVLLILNTCSGVADGGQGNVVDVTWLGLPWHKFSFARGSCSSTAQRNTSVPLWQVV